MLHRILGTYRVDDPRCAVPRRSVDSRPQVEEKDGRDAAVLKVVCRVVGRVDDVDVCANDPHADRPCDSSDEQQLPSSQLIDQKQEPDECHDGLDNAEQTCQQVHRVGLDTKTLHTLLASAGELMFGHLLPRRRIPAHLEYCGRVVVDRVDAGPVLPEEQHAP